MTERAPDPLKACWLDQPTEETPMTVADIHARIGRHQARKRCEAAFVVPAAASMAIFFEWLDLDRHIEPGAAQRPCGPGLGAGHGLLRLLALAACPAARTRVLYGRRRIPPPPTDRRERNERRTLWLWCFLPDSARPSPCWSPARRIPWGPAALTRRRCDHRGPSSAEA